MRTIIKATGSCIPESIIKNESFEQNEFFEATGTKLYTSNASIISKFSEITGIQERRYAQTEQTASDLAVIAAEDALLSGSIDRETLDFIIVAHNFGDVTFDTNRVSMVPSLASRIKARLKIKNPDCVAYDIAFGCPGWLEGVIQADAFVRAGMARRCMVIGAETLSRVMDPHDRDCMIYSDGSGAVILEASENSTTGIIAHKTRTYAADHAHLLRMDKSYSPFTPDQSDLFLKMNGRKVYEFALTHVPEVMKYCIDMAGLSLNDISKVLVHQANDKMDEAILHRLFQLYATKEIPEGIMPMTIQWLGNSSVATIPTLLDLILKKKLNGHYVQETDCVLMASVGAGMNVNALLYRF